MYWGKAMPQQYEKVKECKKSTIPKALTSSKMALTVDRQGLEPWTP